MKCCMAALLETDAMLSIFTGTVLYMVLVQLNIFSFL